MNIHSTAVPLLQRVRGEGRIAAKHSGGRTRLDTLYQDGAAKIRLPRRTADPLEAVLINTAGGVTGGDRLDWQADAADNCNLTLTTQACEKTYKSTAGRAEITVRLVVGANARLAWLPQETILFDRAALSRSIEADVSSGGSLLLVEPVVFGRAAMNETVRQCRFHDRWRIRHEGRLIHAEDFRLDGDIADILANRAVLDGATAMASLLLLGKDAESLAGAANELLNGIDDARGAAGFIQTRDTGKLGETGKLIARIVAKDGYCLRRALIPLIELLNGAAGLPKIWAS